MPIANIASVLAHGILSHDNAMNLPHSDVSFAKIQSKRDSKEVPNGLKLHQYANLYFHARNPMMYKRQGQINELCVLSISNQVINLPGVVLTDQNAASDYVRFLAPTEYDKINFDWVYADDWRDSDQIIQWRKSSAKCAEVLVPHRVETFYIQRAYIVKESLKESLSLQGFKCEIVVNPNLFFR